MTPAARVAAAIEILDDIAAGRAGEQALTRWARKSRFAGSKDRAAVRDHVFDVLRCRREAAHHGKGESGRALMVGLLHLQGVDPATLFSGEGHAPAPLTPQELPLETPPEEKATQWNLPDWQVPLFEDALGVKAATTARALRDRAPVTLRVNTLKCNVEQAQAALNAAGVSTCVNPLAPGALTVLDGARKLRASDAYQDGWIELQDASSQAVVAGLPSGGKVLDYCAGGGGKALALAMDPSRQVFAHDRNAARMQDLGPRAKRAGARITPISSDALRPGSFDLVLCDAPCSGSGAWRRAPEGKWRLTPERLDELVVIQRDILAQALPLLRPGGMLAYATCSVFARENEEQVTFFLQNNPRWKCGFSKRFHVDSQGDGFYIAHLTHV